MRSNVLERIARDEGEVQRQGAVEHVRGVVGPFTIDLGPPPTPLGACSFARNNFPNIFFSKIQSQWPLGT